MAANPRVLVSEPLAASGLDAMTAAGLDVDLQTGLSEQQLLGAVAGCGWVCWTVEGAGGAGLGTVLSGGISRTKTSPLLSARILARWMCQVAARLTPMMIAMIPSIRFIDSPLG